MPLPDGHIRTVELRNVSCSAIRVTVRYNGTGAMNSIHFRTGPRNSARQPIAGTEDPVPVTTLRAGTTLTAPRGTEPRQPAAPVAVLAR